MLINNTLKKLQLENKKAFIPYITAGDPDLASTKKFVKSLVAAGADIIELGIPFSDPVADGVVNQRSSQRALENNVSLENILDLVKDLRNEDIFVPIVIFTYFNPLFKMGIENFAQKAKESKANGALIVDLPPEAAGDYKNIMDKHGLETIFLASPTTSKDRLALIDQMSSGFIYYVARNGVTGVQSDISVTLEKELAKLKENVNNPICLGFGISTPEQAKEVAKLVEGVIVGSAIVKIIEENFDSEIASEKIYDFSKSIADAIKYS